MATTDPRFREVMYKDELMADGTVCRRYDDGRIEWRTRCGDDRVEWRDNFNHRGVDEPLGDGVLKRVRSDGHTIYGKEQGFGRTAWSDYTLTVNRSSLPGRTGLALAGLTGGAIAAGIVMPPTALTAAEEEELRRKAREAASGGAGGDSGVDSEDDPGDRAEHGAAWDSAGDDWGGDDDFG